MGNRLTQIATRTGDAGTTGLGNNQRVSKNSLRIHALGDVDELNSHIGLLLCERVPADVRELLVEVQHQLFNLGGELSIPGYELLKAEAVLALDEALAHHNAALPRLQEFILPAGTRAAAQAHVCRTVARRAERVVVALGNEEAINDAPRQYLNRLSDLMFVLARVLNRMDGGDDVYWKSERLARARPGQPSKGRPAARAASPFPNRACDSREGGRHAVPQGDVPYLGARIAIVSRDTQVSSPASLCISMCHTCVVRPMCTGRAVPVTQPLVAERRWLALMSRPTAR